MNILQHYYDAFSLSQEFPFLSSGQVFASIAVASICGFVISLFYRWSYKGPRYSATFASSLVSLSMIASVVLTVIGNDLARAFGLVGALTIVRFRTAIKDMQDIVFVFFTLAVGIAAGVGLHLTAIAGTVLIGLVILVLSRTNYASPKRREFTLQLSVASSGEEEAPYQPILESYCKRYELVELRSSRGKDTVEFSFHIDFKDRDRSREFALELGQIQGVNQVVLTKYGFGARKRRKRKKKSSR